MVMGGTVAYNLAIVGEEAEVDTPRHRLAVLPQKTDEDLVLVDGQYIILNASLLRSDAFLLPSCAYPFPCRPCPY